jgi:hypothetical protein
MTDDHNYEDIAEQTIAEIKEQVEEEDLDLAKLLEAEKNNKDRKTLKSWLEGRIEEDREDASEEDVADEDEQEERYEKPEVSERLEPEQPSGLKNQTRTVFVIGLIAGILLGGLAFYASGGSSAGGITASQAEQNAVSVAEQTLSQDPRFANVSYSVEAQSVDGSRFSDVYVSCISLKVDRSGDRPIPVFVTKDTGIVFFQAINSETGQPISGQCQTSTGNQTQG